MQMFLQQICREADVKREDMKWLVQTLDMLSSHCPEQEAFQEQTKLENLISRYKNLIPTIEITMVKTESFSRCYTYRREVHEVICILEHVKEQFIKEEQPRSLQNVEKMILQQQSAVSQLDQHRPIVMSILQKGKDLMKDSNTPAFVQHEVHTLETGWNDAYGMTTDRLQKLRGAQKVWSNYEDQKEEILTELTNVKKQLALPSQEDVYNLEKQLQTRYVIDESLKAAKDDKINKLRAICTELCTIANVEQQPFLQKEVRDIETKLSATIENVDQNVKDLEKYNKQWKEINTKLENMKIWTQKTGPYLVSQIQSESITPEERVQKSTSLQQLVQERMMIINELANEAAQIEKETNSLDASRLKAEIIELEKIIIGLQKSTDSQTRATQQDLVKWQKYKAEISEIKPWLEKSEMKVATGMSKPSTLQEAVQLQQQAKLFEKECETQLSKLQNLATLSHQMTNKTSAPDEVDAVHSRWAVVHDMAQQWTSKLDKLVNTWQLFDSEANKLETWISGGEKIISKRTININTPQVDKLERELTKLKSFNNEISQQQAKIVTLTQNSDSIGHALSPEGAAIVKARVANLKERVNSLADTVRQKSNDLSDKIIERQEFQGKLTDFENWMDSLKRKIELHDQIHSDRVEPVLQAMHVLMQEHAEKQPEFNSIYTEVKNMSLDSTPEESRLLNDTYSTLVENYQKLETYLQQNKSYLEKWTDFLNWYDDAKQQLSHIKYRVEGQKQIPEECELIKEELNIISEKILTWNNQAASIDNLPHIPIKDKQSGRSLTVNTLLRELEQTVEKLKSQIVDKKDHLDKVNARWNKFNDLQKSVETTLQSSKVALTGIAKQPTASNKETITEILKHLDSLDHDLEQKQPLRGDLREEGLHLMREDPNKMAEIQHLLSACDNNWEQTNGILRDTRNKYSVLSSTLQELLTFKGTFDRDVDKANQLLESCTDTPSGYIPANQALEKCKKSAEMLKRSKTTLDQMELIKQSILKQAAPLGGFDTTSIENEYLTSQTRWEKVHDAAIKRIQDLESQTIIWKQIDDNKDQLLNWLSDTSQALSNATDNLEVKFGQSTLNKYKEELPLYTNIKNNIQVKIEQLTNLNKGKPVPNLTNLSTLLEDQFHVLKDLADSLESAASTLDTHEKEVRADIKNVSDTISKLREEIIKCDDMTGESTKILERLTKCQQCKEQLENSCEDIDNITMRVNELNSNYPGFAETIVPKELASVQKRFDVVTSHANKIEATLLTFLKKMYTDKFAMLQRNLKALEEKAIWCAPESGSDKYNLEVKMAALEDVKKGIADCNTRIEQLNQSFDLLECVESPDTLKVLKTEKSQTIAKLAQLNKSCDDIKDKLQKNIDLWLKYELMSENISSWLKDVEGKVRSETVSLLDLDSIDEKIKEIEAFKKEVDEYSTDINDLSGLGDDIVNANPESRVGQYVSHLVTRYDTVGRFLVTYIDKLNELKKNKQRYLDNIEAFKQWLKDAAGKIEKYQNYCSSSARPSQAELDELKRFAEEREKGQALLNEAVEAGESLFTGITPENRDAIRNDLRGLRDNMEESIDKVNTVCKTVESIMMQRSSFDETFGQVANWIADKQQSIGSLPLSATLQEKKAALHISKNLLQDINLHKSIVEQLNDKISALSDDESNKKLHDILNKYNNSAAQVTERISTCDSHISNHENYLQILENCRDWLNALITESSMIDDVSATDREDVESKLATVENLLQQKSEGDKIMAACDSQLQVVLKETAKEGHPALLQEFQEQNDAWDSFLTHCTQNQLKLKNLLNTWTENELTLDTLDEWLKQKENQMRDQSLKSSLDAKVAYLNKLKGLESEVASKGDEIAKAVEKTSAMEGDSDIAVRISKLSTRYQTLRNTVKEVISRYHTFVNEHEQFEKDYSDLEEWLKTKMEEVKGVNEIVGDYAMLQDKQNKARELSDLKNKETPKFESLLDRGEKLYNHTSPDGREIIRQQLRNIRALWESFGDVLQDTSNNLDQCLLQFSDFSLAQEQLTKWLKDVEKAMQQHTELKASLQEKRAQLQNHKIMHQEIMSHQQLVESVCDKAQQLVDQTQDASLNVYLQSIKQLFLNIVSKSEHLQNNLDDCVKKHSNLLNECKDFKDWLNMEKEKLHECEDVSGEKSDIIRKIATIATLKSAETDGAKKLDAIRETSVGVNKSTSQPGIQAIQADIEGLQNDLRGLLKSLSNAESKQQHTLKQWDNFESQSEKLLDWLRVAESSLRDQVLLSDLPEKSNQLELYTKQRDEVTKKEKEVDEFIDKSHTLLQISGAERLKPLISQISNRYQQLHITTKEVINHWSKLVDDHKKFNKVYDETLSWLTPLEENINFLNDQSNTSPLDVKANKLQVLLLEREKGDQKIAVLTATGETLLPDTSAQGREKIRQDLRDVRERWDKLNDGIKQQQKYHEIQSLQWSSYQETLQQTLAWLDEKEKLVQQENAASTSVSTQEIRSKLLKNKTLLQEILSHKRVIEVVTEKAQTVTESVTSDEQKAKNVQETVKSIWERYDKLTSNLKNLIAQLDNCLDVYQQFNDMQKSHQDYQKQLWERLQMLSDYSGNKGALQSKLKKIQELQDNVPDGHSRIKMLSDHVQTRAQILPPRAKEAMVRDLSTLTVDFEKFVAALSDIKRGLEERLAHWSEYETTHERLLAWLSEAEISLKNFAPKATLPEKSEQLEKYQVRFSLIYNSIIYHNCVIKTNMRLS